MATSRLHEIRSSAPEAWRRTALPGVGTPAPPLRPAAAALSERDLELVALLTRGLSTGRIAAAMAVTPNTVRTRIRRVQRKLAVNGRDQVARRARGLGLG